MTSRREWNELELVDDAVSADPPVLFTVKYTAIAAGCAALAGTTLGAALPAIGALVVPSIPVGELLEHIKARRNSILILWLNSRRHRPDHGRDQGELADLSSILPPLSLTCLRFLQFGWRHRGNHFRQAWLVGGEGTDARKDEERDAEEAESEFSRPTVHRRAEDAWKSEQAFA